MGRSLVAVVAVSGGMDSCVAAAVAAQDHDLGLLHVNYGQRTERRELRAFGEIADFYGAGLRLVVDARSLAAVGGSSLTDATMPVPEADVGRQEVPTTYVPFRNAHLLCIGVSWAEVIGARKVYIGVEAESGYPDCSPAFISAFNRAVAAGTRPGSGIEVVAPLAAMTKAEIVRLGVKLGAPLDRTWSCYQSEDLACGRCDSCALRLRGFRLAGVKDPIQYIADCGLRIAE
jgi:7-cyano-7-deazaguanine synthase